MLGFASQSSAQQGSAGLVNELTGTKEHGRSFLATAMFVLGTEVDRENLISFMLEQGLFGMQIFEPLLQNRDYCDAYYTFRRLERAFVASPDEEEMQLRSRMDKLNAQFGGLPCGVKLFEADDQDKARVDAHLAAVDLLEVMALTPSESSHSIAATSSNCSFHENHSPAFRAFRGRENPKNRPKEIADHSGVCPTVFRRQQSSRTPMRLHHTPLYTHFEVHCWPSATGQAGLAAPQTVSRRPSSRGDGRAF
jgi:hypothetical protein